MSITVPASTTLTVAAGKIIDLRATGAAIKLANATNAVVVLAVLNNDSTGADGGKLLFGSTGLELSLPATNATETLTAVAAGAFEAAGSSNIDNLPAQSDAEAAKFIHSINNNSGDTKGQITITGYGSSQSSISATTTWSDNS
jgi:hypothetical protein